MSKHFGESMSNWEREQDERDWKRRASLAIERKDRKEILSLIKEGVDNEYDTATIVDLEEEL